MDKPKKVGAPIKLTREIIKNIHFQLRNCAYAETAARMCGIPKSTFYYWLEKAKESECAAIYRELLDTVEKAQAEAETRATEIILKAAESGQWKAALSLLERRFPQRWGPRQTLEHISKDNETIEMSDEELKIEHERINGIINKLLH